MLTNLKESLIVASNRSTKMPRYTSLWLSICAPLHAFLSFFSLFCSSHHFFRRWIFAFFAFHEKLKECCGHTTAPMRQSFLCQTDLHSLCVKWISMKVIFFHPKSMNMKKGTHSDDHVQRRQCKTMNPSYRKNMSDKSAYMNKQYVEYVRAYAFPKACNISDKFSQRYRYCEMMKAFISSVKSCSFACTQTTMQKIQLYCVYASLLNVGKIVSCFFPRFYIAFEPLQWVTLYLLIYVMGWSKWNVPRKNMIDWIYD